MGYLLLWIESLASSLLLVAALMACVGRVQSRWRRRTLAVLVVLLPLIFYAGLTGADAALEFGNRVRTGWFWPFFLLTLSFLVGAMEIARRGLWRAATADGVPAANWPRAKLALALGAAVMLHAMTFSNLDAAVKQSLATVRAEATALALSVAPQRLPDQDNAATIYRQAFDAMGVERADGPIHDWPQVWHDAVDTLNPEESHEFDFKSAELGEFLTHRSGLLALLRAAAARPDCYFDRDYGRPSADMPLPEMQDLREASRLLAIHALWAAGKGDRKSALSDVNAIYAIARHTGIEPILVSMLVSAAIDQLASGTLEAVLRSAHATAEELSGVYVDGGISYRRMLGRALRMEEAFTLTMFTGLDNEGLSLLWALAETDDRPPFPPVGPLYRVFLLSDDMAAYRTFMHEHEQLFASQSYAKAKTRLEELDAEIKNQRPGLLTALLVPGLIGCNRTAVKADAKRRLAQAALAMHRYRAEKGEFAEKLDDLTPDFIPLVPRDPYDGQPLKLKKTANGWIIYSVGPNMKADNFRGLNFDSMAKTGALTFEYVEPQPESEQK